MFLVDCHCHLDMYPNPVKLAQQAAKRSIQIIAVTNLPSHFQVGLPVAKNLESVDLALGLHPRLVEKHKDEIHLFEKMLKQTTMIGEVGLDFFERNQKVRERQIETFEFVAKHASINRKIMSIHSRSAEDTVLKILRRHDVRAAIFHWYSGSPETAREAIEDGYYFSVNPAMSLSAKGQELIRILPRDKVLLESDGPHLKIRGKSASPLDLSVGIEHLSSLWRMPPEDTKSQLFRNLSSLKDLIY